MKTVLFDEGVPHGLRAWLNDVAVVTIQWLGWTGVQNDELLRRIEENRFDVVITVDQQWEFQQNVNVRSFGVVVLSNGNWIILRALAQTGNLKSRFNTAVQDVKPGEIVFLQVV